MNRLIIIDEKGTELASYPYQTQEQEKQARNLASEFKEKMRQELKTSGIYIIEN